MKTSLGLKNIPTVSYEFAGKDPYLKSRLKTDEIWLSFGGIYPYVNLLFLKCKSIKNEQVDVFLSVKLIFFCYVIFTVLKSIYSWEITMLPSDPSPFTSRLNTLFDWLKLELKFYDVPEPGLWYPIYKLWEAAS